MKTSCRVNTVLSVLLFAVWLATQWNYQVLTTVFSPLKVNMSGLTIASVEVAHSPLTYLPVVGALVLLTFCSAATRPTRKLGLFIALGWLWMNFTLLLPYFSLSGTGAANSTLYTAPILVLVCNALVVVAFLAALSQNADTPRRQRVSCAS